MAVAGPNAVGTEIVDIGMAARIGGVEGPGQETISSDRMPELRIVLHPDTVISVGEQVV